MPANYVLLEKITVGAAGASSVTFSGIPQTGYTDLVLKISARGGQANTYATYTLAFNGSTSNRSMRQLYANGSTATSGSDANIGADSVGSTATANTFSNGEIYIPNYTSSNFKSLSLDNVTENNATEAWAELYAPLWSDTAAITSIVITGLSSNFAQYSTFYLYGVAKLDVRPIIAPSATGGDIIMTDGSYWYHAFRSSGTFTPVTALSCDYLVVAGGGGGNSYGGGGGAGGLRSTVTATGGGGSLESRLSLAANTNYTVTIGAGGSAGNTGSPWTSFNGSNSVFSTITSTGGGGVTVSAGNVGGSGGGGVFASSAAAGTANQGYAGGPSQELASYAGSGGGGAGAVGLEGTYGGSTRGGNGGAGVSISAFASPTGTGVSNFYAGGGAGGAWYNYPGGTGGSGGGGAGGYNATVAGVANTGSGGGGSGSSSGSSGALSAGGNGGSGIVIVRYAV